MQNSVQRQHDEQISNLLPSFLTIPVFCDVTLCLAGSSRPFEGSKCPEALGQSVQEESLRNVGNHSPKDAASHPRQPHPPQDMHMSCSLLRPLQCCSSLPGFFDINSATLRIALSGPCTTTKVQTVRLEADP